MTEETIYEGKTAAIWSYLSILGLLIAFSMNGESQNPYAKFHIRQSLGLQLSFILIMLPLGYFDSWLISGPFLICFFALFIYGLISSVQGSITPVPIVGALYQRFLNPKK